MSKTVINTLAMIFNKKAIKAPHKKQIHITHEKRPHHTDKLPPLPDSPLSAPGHSKAEPAISEPRRRYKVGNVRARHINSKICMIAYYSQHSSLNLKGDWLKEAGFETGRGVTVRITEGGLTIIADNNEIQELLEELYQVKQVVKGVKDVLV